ncbi:TolC family protein [Natranaerofaba carboxydovora]|uniref:TolC family protein n=1 Tax=Natranaerofaba carboxydovora TaxID=2742683 RepID=UPI001F146A30|nr:TolC family protein [Natranaerofaba carboxydovora]UMZ74630.1 Outer membrane efflux protein [Natranaerofaba carboxydovora]
MKKLLLMIFVVGLLSVFIIMPGVMAEEENNDNDEEEKEEVKENNDENEKEDDNYEVSIEDLFEVVDEEKDTFGVEKDEEETGAYYRRLTLEGARDIVLNSPQALQAELGLEMADIGVDMAEEQYQDMKEMREDIDDLIDDLEEEKKRLEDEEMKEAEDNLVEAVEELYEVLDEEAMPEMEDVIAGMIDDAVQEAVDEAIEEAMEEQFGDVTQEESSGDGSGSNGEGDIGIDDEVYEELIDKTAPVMTEIANLSAIQMQIAMFDQLLDATDEMDYEDMLDDMVAEAEQGKRETKQERDIAYMEWEEIGKKELKFGAESMYIGLLVMDEQLETAKMNLANVERTIKQEEARKNAGLSTDLSVDALKLQKNEIEDNIESLQNSRDDLKREFLSFIGVDMDETVYLEPISFDLEDFEESFNFEQSLDYAKYAGNEIRLQEKKVEFAEDNLDFAANEHGVDSDSYRMYGVELEQAELDKEVTREDIEKSMNENYNAFNEAMNDYRLAEEGLDLQVESVKADKIMIENGMITENDYLDSLTELNETISLIEQAKFQAYLAKRELIHLDEEGIVLDAGGDMDMEQDMEDGMAPEGPDMEDSDEMDDMEDDGMDSGMDMDPGMNQDGPESGSFNTAPGMNQDQDFDFGPEDPGTGDSGMGPGMEDGDMDSFSP